MKELIAPDSRASDIVDTLSNPIEYVRQIMENFVSGQYDRNKAAVRIGVAGIGVAPNYKIEYATNFQMTPETKIDLRAAKIYHGRNHKEITAFANQDTREEHWSTRSMSYAELSDLIGLLRRKKKTV